MNPNAMRTPQVVDIGSDEDFYDKGKIVEVALPHPDDLGQQMADLNRRAKQELEQLDLRVALLRRVVNITDSALHADDQPQQASSEPFGCSF